MFQNFKEIFKVGSFHKKPGNDTSILQTGVSRFQTTIKNRYPIVAGGLLSIAILILIFLGFVLFISLPSIQEKTFLLWPKYAYSGEEELNSEVAELVQLKQKNIEKLQLKLNKLTPSGTYLLVNTSENEFYLFQGKKLLRQGKCSTGSYTKLIYGDNQKWLFKTPKGIHRIRDKRTTPVWKKPDWAFVEEGLPIPPPDHFSRFEYGTLGDYALDLGQGYLIHGTLYQRFLGLPVTHGCIRMGDDDLEQVYRTLNFGSRVYIF
jgi:hypothetical protein